MQETKELLKKAFNTAVSKVIFELNDYEARESFHIAIGRELDNLVKIAILESYVIYNIEQEGSSLSANIKYRDCNTPSDEWEDASFSINASETNG